MMKLMRSIPSTTAPKPFPMQITKNRWLRGIYHKLHGLWMRLPPLLFMLDLIAELLSYARQVHRLTHRRRIVRLNGLINIFRKRNVKSSLFSDKFRRAWAGRSVEYFVMQKHASMRKDIPISCNRLCKIHHEFQASPLTARNNETQNRLINSPKRPLDAFSCWVSSAVDKLTAS